MDKNRYSSYFLTRFLSLVRSIYVLRLLAGVSSNRPLCPSSRCCFEKRNKVAVFDALDSIRAGCDDFRDDFFDFLGNDTDLCLGAVLLLIDPFVSYTANCQDFLEAAREVGDIFFVTFVGKLLVGADAGPVDVEAVAWGCSPDADMPKFDPGYETLDRGRYCKNSITIIP